MVSNKTNKVIRRTIIHLDLIYTMVMQFMSANNVPLLKKFDIYNE